MAASFQNLVVFILLTIFSFGNITQASIENIDLNYTQPAATFDELYEDGIRLYSNESWVMAIRSFMLAIADHRQEAEVRANCIIQCREKVDKSDVLRNGLYDGGSLVLYYVIRVRRCADLCQEKYLGRRGPIAKYVRDAFERRQPYNYMQFAFYKVTGRDLLFLFFHGITIICRLRVSFVQSALGKHVSVTPEGGSRG